MTISRTCLPVAKLEDDCYDWDARHASRCKLVAENSYEWIFIGDSITHFWKNTDAIVSYGDAVWDEFYSHRKALNLGYGFDRTQNVLWRIANGELEGQTPEVIVLNIGTNQFSITPTYSGDTPEAAAEGIVTVVKTLSERFPKAKIIVMAIFPRGTAKDEFRPKITATNEFVKKAIEALPNIAILDIGTRLTTGDGELRSDCYQFDLTHLAEPGYRIWAEALEEATTTPRPASN